MNQKGRNNLAEILSKYEGDLLDEWIHDLTPGAGPKPGSGKDSELRNPCRAFLGSLLDSLKDDQSDNLQSDAWSGVREVLTNLSRSRGLQGYSPSETASFVFSLKRPLFDRIRQAYSQDPQALADTTWVATELLDRLGLYTTEVHQKAREEVIARQQQEMLELSTPVVKLWEGVLALPVIGTLDSGRTQMVMESLLQKIVETGSGLAIIDITGVPTVDTLTAQYLLKTVTAARLMGAECIISGIRPQIAQTIVHLGMELTGITTKATLADAFAVALDRTGRMVTRKPART